MKKILLTSVVAVLMTLMVTAPSFAIETKVNGTFTLNGVLNLNEDLNDEDDTVSYREMQLRIHTETQVTDKISFFTRFDILDKVLSSQFSNTGDEEEDDNIQFDHAWLQIISPVGLFRLGRKEGVKWGTDFFDDGEEYGTDRAEWIVPIDVGDNKFYMVAVAEKALETKRANRDNDKFYFTGTYVTDNFKTGLLTGLYKYNSYQEEEGSDEMTESFNDFDTKYAAATQALADYTAAQAAAVAAGTAYVTEAALLDAGAPGVTNQTVATANSAYVNAVATATGAGVAAQAAGAAATDAGATLTTATGNYKARGDGEVMYLAPYFSGNIGPFRINAEYDYVDGELEFKNVNSGYQSVIVNNYGQDFYNSVYGTKKDVKMSGYWLELGYDMGPASIEFGTAYMSGDEDGSLNDLEAAALIAPGEDWQKVFILTGDAHGMDKTLGGGDGAGNVLDIGSDMNYAGYEMYYLAGSYAVTEDLKLGGLVAYANAAEKLKKYNPAISTTVPYATYEKEYGTEVDLTLSWKFMGNLTYNGTIAHLFAGDFWEKGDATAKVDDVTSLYHELVLNF